MRAVTQEIKALPAETKLWLTGWTKTIGGGELVSVLLEIADEGGRVRSKETVTTRQRATASRASWLMSGTIQPETRIAAAIIRRKTVSVMSNAQPLSLTLSLCVDVNNRRYG